LTAYALQAQWLLPIATPPIENGIISIDDGRITAVGENITDSPPEQLGEVALLPALINAHTHLEFSDLTAPLGEANMPFAKWIGRVIDYRRQRSGNEAAAKQAAIQQGLAESHESCVAAIGEIATLPHDPSNYDDAAVDTTGVQFLELLGLAPEREAELIAAARDHLQQASTDNRWQMGLSPHSPYTASPQLVASAVELAREFDAPVAMHLAETREEMELLATGGGPLADFLKELGAWREGAIELGSEPLDYLQLLAESPRSLVIHGNYLVEEELQFLAEHRQRMTLVYCPRTHARFGHPAYPLLAALRAGVRVALGTDSRASNPDLSLWEELRHISHQFPQLAGEDILRMGTLHGAEALGLDAELGSLEAGKQARLAIAPLTGDDADLYSRLLKAESRLCEASRSSMPHQ
jgi:cytosine/adenosine deaminase-related metal-dependent hydrolase